MKLNTDAMVWVKAILWLVFIIIILGAGVLVLLTTSIRLDARIMTALVCFLISGGFFYFYSIKDFKALLK